MRVVTKFQYILITLTWILLFVFTANTLAAKGGGRGKGGGGDPAIIEITFSGSVTGATSCENKFNADTTILGCNKGGGFTFTDPILEYMLINSDCFQQVQADPPDSYVDGTIQLFDNTDSAEAWFRFWDKGENGVNDVLFVLEAHDLEGWFGAFPPEYNADASTMTTDNGIAMLRATNKRQERDARGCLSGFPDDAEIQISISRITP